MEIQVNLSKDECNYILDILHRYENEILRKSLNAIQKLNYETAKGFYKDKKSFEQDIKFKKTFINQQIQDIEKIYEKISSKMEEEYYE